MVTDTLHPLWLSGQTMTSVSGQLSTRNLQTNPLKIGFELVWKSGYVYQLENRPWTLSHRSRLKLTFQCLSLASGLVICCFSDPILLIPNRHVQTDKYNFI